MLVLKDICPAGSSTEWWIPYFSFGIKYIQQVESYFLTCRRKNWMGYSKRATELRIPFKRYPLHLVIWNRNWLLNRLLGRIIRFLRFSVYRHSLPTRYTYCSPLRTINNQEVIEATPVDYTKVNKIGCHFSFHDIEWQRSLGFSDETISLMKKQNSITEKAYIADAKKRGVVPVMGW